MSELISVIIPIYNVEKYLKKCVSSVLNQTYKQLQIILVDDGSTDSSGDICDRYALEDNRIKVIHRKNGGLVSARKAGLSAATGEYVAYVDGDDWIEPDFYQRLLQEMIDSKVDLVDTDIYKDFKNKLVKLCNKVNYGRYDVDDIISFMLFDDNFNECNVKVSLVSKLFKRDILKNVQYSVSENICFGEDAAVTFPYILKCKRISLLDYCGYHYVQRLDSIVYTKSLDEVNQNKMLIRGLYKCFKEDTRAEILLPQLNQYAKLLFLLRNVSYFDKDKLICMRPFGNIYSKDKVVIYGAGKVGQNIYNYLKDEKNISVIDWLDREYEKYQQVGFPVHMPQRIYDIKERDFKIIIAIGSRSIADSIHKWLLANGIKEESIMWLTEEFINSDLLSELINAEE